MKEIEYGPWSAHPGIIDVSHLVIAANAIYRKIDTKHEGKIVYEKCWNFWVRAGLKGDLPNDQFFRDFDKSDKNTLKLFGDIGVPAGYPKSENGIWDRIAIIWSWLATHVQFNAAEYGAISSQFDCWPSILDYAEYYAAKGGLVWAACFSKAHLFAALLGRVIPARRRILIAEAHHTEMGAPQTATHVYVAVYVSDRWYYLDPTALPFTPFPMFGSKQSLGVGSFPSVDYEHPCNTIMLPGSDFAYVPYLSA